MNIVPVIFVRHSEEIAASILNRPEKRNALSIESMRQLCAHAEQIEKDGRVRVWILRGNGPAFCAGLDLGEVKDSRLGVESARLFKQCLSTVYRMPVVTLAVVHGPAMGGGAGLVAACDFAIADSKAAIGFPEVRLGLIPAQIMSVLVRKLKRTDIQDLLLSGKTLNAERALQIGLFSRVGDLKTETQGIISEALKTAPGALAKTKQLMDQLFARPLQDDIEMCMQQYIQVRNGTEAQEGIKAFIEKRKPAWEKSWKLHL